LKPRFARVKRKQIQLSTTSAPADSPGIGLAVNHPTLSTFRSLGLHYTHCSITCEYRLKVIMNLKKRNMMIVMMIMIPIIPLPQLRAIRKRTTLLVLMNLRMTINKLLYWNPKKYPTKLPIHWPGLSLSISFLIQILTALTYHNHLL
jgi:hypothetical protein